MRSSDPAGDYDSPWKEALERYFPLFMAFFFPHAHADIDWSRGYQFLDKELQQVVRDAALGRRVVDKLVKVWRTGGAEAWVLVHVEVQGQVDPDFARRMYVYNYRLFDRYQRQVASLAVLGDPQRDWRPDRFTYDLWGSEVSLRFPVVKLLDYNARWEALEVSGNPFAVLVMAHLKTEATRRDPGARLQWKLRLVTGLYERGYSRDDVLELFRFIDWMMALPEELTRQFDDAIEELEEAGKMTYMTKWERRGRELGFLAALQEAVVHNLEIRFGVVPNVLRDRIQAVDDVAMLKALHETAVTAENLDGFQEALGQAPGG